MLNTKALRVIAEMLFATADPVEAAERLPNLDKAAINKQSREDVFNAMKALNSELGERPDAKV